MPSTTTPVRGLGRPDDAGLRFLSDPGIAYADGAESRLERIVGAASDLSSSSEELAGQGEDWATTYSLSPVRANLLRGLDLRPGMKVLEIGCGCGPITRHLGEVCGTVDSVEPMAARARVARLRTRDLPDVEIHVGLLEDVPREPVYDVVVIVGVLEYVGGGTPDLAPYRRFLEHCRDVLVDGGTVVVAIENALGVKYLAGAPEDHTDRPFDSLEGYLLPTPARTFGREQLTALMAQVGLDPHVLAAFPDYKMPRVLMDDALFGSAPGLAEDLPRFPSPDWLTPRLQAADERMLWRTLVRDGVGPRFANSFVVVARTGGAGPELWPAGRLAVAFDTEHRPSFAVRTDVVLDDAGPRMVRTRLHDAPVGAGDVRHEPTPVEPVVAGTDMVQLMLEDPARRADLLQAWAEQVPDDEWAPVDLVPDRIKVVDGGGLVAVGRRWAVRGYERDCLLVRGLVRVVLETAARSRRDAGEPPVTVRGAVEELAAAIDLDVDDDLVARFVAAEARFRAAVLRPPTAATSGEAVHAAALRELLAADVSDVRGGRRLDVLWREAAAEHQASRDHVALLGLHVEKLERELATLRMRLDRSAEERVRRRLRPAVLRLRRRPVD